MQRTFPRAIAGLHVNTTQGLPAVNPIITHVCVCVHVYGYAYVFIGVSVYIDTCVCVCVYM